MTKIIADAGSLCARKNEPATADIWLEINGTEFPARNWNDFAVVIMGWWSDALLRILRKISDRELIDFMDGPYAVEVTCVPGGRLMLRALQGVDRKLEVEAGEVFTLSFVHEFVFQAHRLLDACKHKNWWSKDAEMLAASLQPLNLELLRIRNR
ncbi:hypothetical protein [Luteimonas salinilitoris]|uniref:Uncharacterized protein n=1 Tax=Luteimonas salinilitoris TaxID=3237697 RepID=A0ABV4HLX0_9GAMM